MSLQSVKNPADLLTSAYAELPYDFVNFIATDTFRSRRLAKRRLKLIKVIDPTLAVALHPGERVFFVSEGLRLGNLEQLFIGWVVAYYNLVAFVFTSERILLVHLRERNKRGSFLSAIDYADVRDVKATFWGRFRLRFVNGKSLVFAKMGRVDRKYLSGLMATLLERSPAIRKEAPGIRTLCPACAEEVKGFPEACPSCQISFKRPRTAALLSLLFPGLGDWYLGSRLLAVIEIGFMAFLWRLALFPLPIEGTEGGTGEVLVGPGAVALIFFHVFDAAKSMHLAQKGLMPRRPIRYAPRSSVAPPNSF